MQNLLRPFAIAGLSIGLLGHAQAFSTVKEKDPYHVMWTSPKGKTKCVTKSTKAKAEKSAEILRRYNFANVQVEAGSCKKK